MKRRARKGALKDEGASRQVSVDCLAVQVGRKILEGDHTRRGSSSRTGARRAMTKGSPENSYSGRSNCACEGREHRHVTLQREIWCKVNIGMANCSR